jgi:hypothetical protein
LADEQDRQHEGRSAVRCGALDDRWSRGGHTGNPVAARPGFGRAQ